VIFLLIRIILLILLENGEIAF